MGAGVEPKSDIPWRQNSPQTSGNPAKGKAEEFYESNGIEDTEEHGLLNQLSMAPMGSQKLKRQAWGLQGLHQVLCLFVVAVSLVFLWDSLLIMGASVSLTFSCSSDYFPPVRFPCLALV